jgi:hypothetical protein
MGDEWRPTGPPKIDVHRWLGDIAKAYEDVLAGGAPPAQLLPWWAPESWHQSRQRGVNPNNSDNVVLGEVEVQRRLRDSRLAPAWDTLWKGLEGVAGGERTVEVTDGDGYVLVRKGDRSSKVWRLASGFGFDVGACMDLNAVGTTAIGVALQHRMAVQVPGPCHWRRNQHGVNCTAVPVPDPRRKNRTHLVINVMGLGPIAHPDTLRLVRVVADNVCRELASTRSKKVEQLREDAGSLDQITGWALVTDRDGWVAASHRLAAPLDRVTFPDELQIKPGWSDLPELGRCVLEPLPGGWLVRQEVRGEDAPVIRVALDLRQPQRRWVTVAGPNVTWQHPLTLRHAEILLLLATARPGGLKGPALSEDLYGNPGTPVRPEMCRLREYAGGLLDRKPYRFSSTVRVAVQRPAARADLLPDSTAPGVIRLRR